MSVPRLMDAADAQVTCAGGHRFVHLRNRRKAVDTILVVVRAGDRFAGREREADTVRARFRGDDAGCAGPLLDRTRHVRRTIVEVVREHAGHRGVAVSPHRWTVRTQPGLIEPVPAAGRY